jgi:hypothetical protein
MAKSNRYGVAKERIIPAMAPRPSSHPPGEDGQPRGNPKLMKARGDGRYHAKLDDLPEGAFKITVQSATPAQPIDPVSDWTPVWDAAAV